VAWMLKATPFRQIVVSGWVPLLVGLAVTSLPLFADDSNQVQNLVRELTNGDRQVRRDAAEKLGTLGAAAKDGVPALIKAIDDQDRQVTSNALEALADLGPEAKEAIPALIDAMDSRKVRGGRGQGRQQSAMRAAFALSRIGTEAIPPLLTALNGDDAMLRQGAAKALGGMGPAAHEAVPALIANLTHPDGEVHQSAIEALVEMGNDGIRPLIEGLASQDARMREGCARALGGIGKAARDAGPKLVELAGSESDVTAKAAALGALSRVGVEPDRCIPLLIQGVRSSDDGVRHAAVNGFASLRPAQPAVAALQTLLPDQDAAVRQRAAHALSRLGSKAAPATAALVACAKAAPDEQAFTDALSQIGESALPFLLQELSAPGQNAQQNWVFRALRDMGAAAMPALVQGLQSPNAPVRAAAARALGDLPVQSPQVTKTLAALTGDPEPSVRAAALRSLATVRTERDAMIPKLEAALQDGDAQVRKAAAAGLASMGAVDKITVPGLVDLLHDSDAATQVAAARALGEMGPKAGEAVGALKDGLGNSTLQASAAEALGKIGAASEPAGPQLLEMARGHDREISITALQALAGVGKPIDGLLPFLYDSVKNDDREIRLSALQALTKIEPDREKLFPVLIKGLQEDSGRVRRVAAQGLRSYNYGERAQEAVPALMAMLDKDTDRQIAVDTLRAIHVRELPPLLTALNHKDAKVRAFACELLGDLGTEAKDAIPALEQKAEGDAQPVRDAAKKALARISGNGAT